MAHTMYSLATLKMWPLLICALSASSISAAPTPDEAATSGSPTITNPARLDAALAALSSGAPSAFAPGYASILSAIQPSSSPTASASAATVLAALGRKDADNLLAAPPALLLSGLTGADGIGNPVADALDFGSVCNGHNNRNTQPPARTIYPKQSARDAPYSVSEADLRSAIYFPPGFTHGRVRPVLFIPGTGVEACESFAPGIGKLVAGSDYADPVYVNVPGNMLADEQTNAEYVAYAINYVSAITNNQKVSLVGWSAAGPVSQWAFKYWPSTRESVQTFVALSPDFRGSVSAPLACPLSLCVPALHQQFYNANWISRLRSNGGDASFVPTTEIHTAFDQAALPQTVANSTSTLRRGLAPVTNARVQDYCPPFVTIAGGPHLGHENMLYNPVSVALALDALRYGVAADPQRAGPFNCSRLLADGLTLADLAANEFDIVLAAANLFLDPRKVLVEPPLRPYATF